MGEPYAALPTEAIACGARYQVVARDRLTPTILELSLRPLEATLEYSPGEYVLLEDDDHALPPRSYSIANAPRPDAAISLLVTRVPDGTLSTWIHARLRVSEIVQLSGPYGTFIDAPIATAPGLLLAAGSGLAPIRALLEAALAEGRRRELMLIFSARREADVIDRDRFCAWQASNTRFRFVRTLTRGPGPPPHGRIPGLLVRLCPDLSDWDVFIAGAPGFVRDCAAAVDALGAPRGRVHTEVFFVEPQPWTIAPPSVEPG